MTKNTYDNNFYEKLYDGIDEEFKKDFITSCVKSYEDEIASLKLENKMINGSLDNYRKMYYDVEPYREKYENLLENKNK